ncbi:MAG: calcium-binding protein [Hyphomicrobium sp.]
MSLTALRTLQFNVANLNPGLVFTPAFVNYMTDLVPVTFMGNTLNIDFGTNDTLVGTVDNDDISIHNGNDTAFGGLGHDVFRDLGAGNDVMHGEDGNDTFYLGAGSDTANGGNGIDTVDYSSIAFTVIADLQSGFAFADGIDTLQSIERVIGSQWNDTMLGSAGADTFYGGLGNDKLVGRGGADTIYGGAGNDRMWGDTEAVPDLAFGSDALYGEDGDDWMNGGQSSDLMYGGNGNDTMLGGEGFFTDTMFGNAGNDTMDGGQGNDVINGGTGRDIMTGGQGVDRFVFSAANEFSGLTPGTGFKFGCDLIMDFEKGVDKIDLSAIDANPNLAGNQAFVFDSYNANSPTVDVDIAQRPGRFVDGDIGHVDVRFDDARNRTSIYVETTDGTIGASIEVVGHIFLQASDFIL